jgi:signal transduction histidine kinase
MSDLSTPTSPSLFPHLPAPLAEGKGRIRPRARLLRTIGAELISSEVVAVIELVRNSYDADAQNVDLVFNHPEEPGRTTLEIRDDGHGMNREILLGPWLEPATDHKSGQGDGGTGGEKSPCGRRRLGSKGVGRFAAQRLGAGLELRTRAEDSPNELVAHFDWNLLERDQYLDQVYIPWWEVPAERLQTPGTHLNITQLRDRWTPERFERLKLGLARLVSPTMRQEFKIRIVINGASEEVEPAIDADTAMYSISGAIDNEGRCTIRYKDVNNTVEEWERTVIWPADPDLRCGPLTFRINAWDLDREPLQLYLENTDSKLGLRDFRRVIRDHSGISLYRDGFRILPYGEPDNDWLRLDRRRVNNPTMRLSNNQILGTIQLTADQNPNLRDQTNREGLVTNEAYTHLTEVVLELLGYLETRRFAARREMDIDWQGRTSSLPDIHDDHSSAKIEQLISNLTEGTADKAEEARRLRTEVRDFRESTADAVRYYAGLASMGQMSGLVFRQLEHPMRQMRSDLGLVLNDLEAGDLDEEDLKDISESVRRALRQLEHAEKRMRTLDPLALGGRSRRLSSQQMNEVLMTVLEPFQDEFHRYGVALDFKGREEVTVRTNREVVQQVLALLVDNAIRFAAEGEAPTPAVTVEVTENGFIVSDNGKGIAKAHRNSVFEPHFTTREDAHGMGLTLARDLLKTIGGSIRLTEIKPATFEVDLGRP